MLKRLNRRIYLILSNMKLFSMIKNDIIFYNCNN